MVGDEALARSKPPPTPSERGRRPRTADASGRRPNRLPTRPIVSRDAGNHALAADRGRFAPEHPAVRGSGG